MVLYNPKDKCCEAKPLKPVFKLKLLAPFSKVRNHPRSEILFHTENMTLVFNSSTIAGNLTFSGTIV
jgi:hypothetical protein